jgi:(p)ppGpp synthase/HD superfamily hydrolase
LQGGQITTQKPALITAFELAERLHRNQFRKRATDEIDAQQIPYLTHLTEVLAYVILGGGNEEQQIAALLHDAIEDQPFLEDGRYTDDYIYNEFGPRVAGYVRACTDGKPGEVRDASSWSERKEHHIAELDKLAKKNPEVLLVSIADKLSNAQAIVADVTQHGDIVWNRFNATPDQIIWYYTQMWELFKKYLDNNHVLLHRYARVVSEMQQISKHTSRGQE